MGCLCGWMDDEFLGLIDVRVVLNMKLRHVARNTSFVGRCHYNFH